MVGKTDNELNLNGVRYVHTPNWSWRLVVTHRSYDLTEEAVIEGQQEGAEEERGDGEEDDPQPPGGGGQAAEAHAGATGTGEGVLQLVGFPQMASNVSYVTQQNHMNSMGTLLNHFTGKLVHSWEEAQWPA